MVNDTYKHEQKDVFGWGGFGGRQGGKEEIVFLCAVASSEEGQDLFVM